MESYQGWNWEEAKSEYWSTPAEDMYYLAERWKGKDFKCLLDLGCGMGRHALFFAMNGFESYAYDLSKSGLDMLEAKSKTLKLPIDIKHGHMNQLPYETCTFHGIIAYHAIYHNDSDGIQQVLKEINRVLLPHGEAYITFLSKKDPSFKDHNGVVDKNTRYKEELDGSSIPHFYCDLMDLSIYLQDFKIIKVKEVVDSYIPKHVEAEGYEPSALKNCRNSSHYYVHLKKMG